MDEAWDMAVAGLGGGGPWLCEPRLGPTGGLDVSGTFGAEDDDAAAAGTDGPLAGLDCCAAILGPDGEGPCVGVPLLEGG